MCFLEVVFFGGLVVGVLMGDVKWNLLGLELEFVERLCVGFVDVEVVVVILWFVVCFVGGFEDGDFIFLVICV